MDFSWPTFVANLMATFAIGFVMYALGQRNGKNQADRHDLRDRYRELLIYFKQLRQRVLDGDPMRPIDWRRYEDGHLTGGPPLVGRLDQEGRLHDLEHADLFRTAEGDAMEFGDQWHSELSHVYDIAVDLLEKMSRVEIIRQEGVVKTPTSGKETMLKEPLGAVLVQERFALLHAGLSAAPAPGVQFAYRGGDLKQRSIVAASDYIPLGTAAFAKNLREDALRLVRLKNVLAARESLIRVLSEAVSRLERLSVEPHSFWGTVREALRDVAGK